MMVCSCTHTPCCRSGGLLNLTQPPSQQLCSAVARQRGVMDSVPLHLVDVGVQCAQLLLQLLQLARLLRPAP